MFNKSAASKPPANTSASAPAKSKYSALASTNPTMRGNYLTPGHYLLRVDSFRKQQGFRAGAMKVAVGTVVHVFPDSPKGASMLGLEASDVMKESNVAFLTRLRAFLDAAGVLTQEDWDREGGEAIVALCEGETQPLAGKVVEVRVSTVVKQTAVNKAPEALLPSDSYTRNDYLRSVPFSELASILSPEEAARFFPNLEELIAAETAE